MPERILIHQIVGRVLHLTPRDRNGRHYDMRGTAWYVSNSRRRTLDPSTKVTLVWLPSGREEDVNWNTLQYWLQTSIVRVGQKFPSAREAVASLFGSTIATI